MKINSVIFILLTLCISCSKERTLPVLNNYIDDYGIRKNYLINDYHFTTQLGKKFTVENTKDKVYIANFFFTKCSSICPPMREKLIDIATTIGSNKFILVSYSIDTKNDSISVLNKYSEKTSISKDKWFFLKGSPEELASISKKFRTSFTKYQNSNDFYHSSYVVLIDTKQQIRGFYDLLNNEAVTLLKEDINLLLNE
jgi:protein SCO1/2